MKTTIFILVCQFSLMPLALAHGKDINTERLWSKDTPKYTEFPGVGHGSWGPAYETTGLWEWMFAQRHQTASSKP